MTSPTSGSTFPDQTRTSDTEKTYEQRARALIQEASATAGDLKQNDVLRHVDVARWLANRKGLTLKKASYRQYRAALKFWFDKYPDPTTDAAHAVLRAVQPEDICRKTSDATTSRRAKKISVETMWYTINSLRNLRYGHAAIDWLIATLWSGLRPCEWPNAKLEQTAEGLHLRVVNGKSTNDRAHGETRTIPLADVTAEGMPYILRHVARVASSVAIDNFDAFYEGCRNAIWEARAFLPRRIQRKRVTLYTMRHQFHADLHRSGRTTRERAALMGHATDRTCQTHYANGRSGSGHRKIKPSPDEVSRVKVSGRQKPYAQKCDGPQGNICPSKRRKTPRPGNS